MPGLFDRISLLKRTPIFSHVSTDDVRVVATVLSEELCQAGDVLFELNDRSDKVYFIYSGRIGVSIDPDSREYVAELGAGDCVGEMAMFDDGPRSATASVLEGGILLSLDKAKLRALLVSYPGLALGMLRTLSERLRESNLKR